MKNSTTGEKKPYTGADITFREMSEEDAVKVFQDDGYFNYKKRTMRYGKDLSRDSKWATAPERMFVAFDGDTPVAVCGIAKYKGKLLGAGIHTRDEYKGRGLFGLCVKKVLSEKNGTIYINVANPNLVGSFRRRGFTDMQVGELPEDIQEELQGTNYPDQVQKWLKSKGIWFDMFRKSEVVIKAMSKEDMIWIRLGNSIMQDNIPFKNPNKYVKYSNLGKDNKRAVKFYLETGLARPKRRNEFYKGIQEEMLRGSNVRYDVEDQSRGDR
tara:strand:+ start:8932 stop:9738 length:807 start_codon:yes stop_codon:yes gene_type:complete